MKPDGLLKCLQRAPFTRGEAPAETSQLNLNDSKIIYEIVSYKPL